MIALLAGLAGCAAPERVVLLPQPDGTPSAVIVRTSTGETTLSEPYATATVAGDRIDVGKTDEATVRQQYQALFAAQPPRPRKFLLYFESGADKLTAESEALLGTILRDLDQFPAGELVVVGHTDRTGSDESNDELSLRRANVVRDILVAKGTAGERVQAVGRGEREPLVPTADGVAEPRNRRVEIRVR